MNRINSIHIFFISAALLALLFYTGACTKDVLELPPIKKEEPKVMTRCDSLAVTFSNTVKEIFTTNCAISGCHKGPAGQAGVVLETHAQIKTQVDNGRIKARMFDAAPGPMPPGGKLADDQLEKVQCWMDDGAPDN